jgi:hypothetical protein
MNDDLCKETWRKEKKREKKGVMRKVKREERLEKSKITSV